MEPKISVIIPVYKVEPYLDECIRSVVDQTYRYLEIIIVDDGSPDNCPAMCDAWAEKDDRIKVIHKENGGLSDARNAGIESATGELIGFVDSDDYIAPEMYEKLMKTLADEDADIVACGIMAEYPDRCMPLPVTEVSGSPTDIFRLLYNNTRFPVSALNKLYKCSCFDSIRFPVGKICEDAFTTFRLVDGAKRIVQIGDPLYHYRIRSGSIMTSEFSRRRMDEEEAWRANYEYMAEYYPEVRKTAFDFYLQKVSVLINAIPVESRAEFAEEYGFLRGILKKNMLYILFGSGIRFKSRIKLLLDCLRL